MLKIKGIKKSYRTGDFVQHALKGIDLEFRQNEFVAILGPSGSGKTTMLNIIGGLDRYDEGDLIINNKSTKQFKEKEWDAYRNNCIGFIFQSYNLIGHISVLQNVEMSMTLSGISAKKRRKKALQVLEKVGLKEHSHKLPNQLSGGQMQRVAIARALVNDPEIIMADEPTGALDTETSVQILDLIKEIANEKLVIMVTHNPDLANEYASRIVNFKDGELISDSNPINENDTTKKELNLTQTKMSFKTALSLSFTNLMTKKGRTALTAVAGSIGIIGIALILSLSHGMQSYIDKVQEETLSSYPLMIQEQSINMQDMMTNMKQESSSKGKEKGKIYSNNVMNKMMSTMTSKVQSNNLEAFKKFIMNNKDLDKLTNAISYSYDLDLQLYKNDPEKIIKVNPSNILEEMGMGLNTMQAEFMSTDIFSQLFENQKLNEQMYDVVSGRWPSAYNEVVLAVDENEEITDYSLYALGLLNQDELEVIMKKIKAGEKIKEADKLEYSYDELLNIEFNYLLNTDYYEKKNNVWINKEEDETFLRNKLNNAEKIKIVGIVKPNDESIGASAGGMVFYTKELTEHIINKNNESEIIKEQIANKEQNVLTGMKFSENTNFDMNNLTDEQKMYFQSMSPVELAQFIESYKDQAGATYDSVLKTIGSVNLEKPSQISIFPKDFEGKEEIEKIIKDYNKKAEDEDRKEDIIEYQDIVGMLMNSVSTIINVISYALMGFVSISLVVSSIMIGIITYISVLERTKEIGILRAIGASKKDITRIFNAETLIEGLIAGLFGIGFTALINIPINIIIKDLTNISGIAKLPLAGAITLVLLSVILTIIGGFLPAVIASKKDPVEALRTE